MSCKLVEHQNQDMDRDMVKIQNISLLKCTTWVLFLFGCAEANRSAEHCHWKNLFSQFTRRDPSTPCRAIQGGIRAWLAGGGREGQA